MGKNDDLYLLGLVKKQYVLYIFANEIGLYDDRFQCANYNREICLCKRFSPVESFFSQVGVTNEISLTFYNCFSNSQIRDVKLKRSSPIC